MAKLRVVQIAKSEGDGILYFIDYQVLGISDRDYCGIRLTAPKEWRIDWERFNAQTKRLEPVAMPDISYESMERALEAIQNHLP